jgi:hypothetical protein
MAGARYRPFEKETGSFYEHPANGPSRRHQRQMNRTTGTHGSGRQLHETLANEMPSRADMTSTVTLQDSKPTYQRDRWKSIAKDASNKAFRAYLDSKAANVFRDGSGPSFISTKESSLQVSPTKEQAKLIEPQKLLGDAEQHSSCSESNQSAFDVSLLASKEQ